MPSSLIYSALKRSRDVMFGVNKWTMNFCHSVQNLMHCIRYNFECIRRTGYLEPLRLFRLVNVYHEYLDSFKSWLDSARCWECAPFFVPRIMLSRENALHKKSFFRLSTSTKNVCDAPALKFSRLLHECMRFVEMMRSVVPWGNFPDKEDRACQISN